MALRVNGHPVPPLEHRLPHRLRAAPRRAPPAAGGSPLRWREDEGRSVALRCARSVKRQRRLSPGAALTSVSSPVAVAPRLAFPVALAPPRRRRVAVKLEGR